MRSTGASFRGVFSLCGGKADASLVGISKAGTLFKQCKVDGQRGGGGSLHGTTSIVPKINEENDKGGGDCIDASERVEWRSFFFVLNGHSLAYYPSGQRKGGLTNPIGDILLTTSTQILLASSSIIQVRTGFESIFLRAKDSSDAKDWKAAIEANIRKVSKLPRGYLIRLRKRRWLRTKRLFFMLHQECITQHTSHADTSIMGTIIPLTETTVVSSFDETGIVVETKFRSMTSKKWKLIADTKREQDLWINSISRVVATKSVVLTLPAVPTDQPGALLDGFLSMRYYGGAWNESFFIVMENSLHRVHYDHNMKRTSSKRFPLTPNTAVSSTNLSSNSFEVVTFSDVLHLNASSKEAKDQWIATIRGLVASAAQYSDQDQLQKASLARDCEYYDVHFRSTNSPGLVLERRGDIALVGEVTRSLQHRVFAGSVLISINGDSVIAQPYEHIASLLSDWRPPLTLRFCKPPEMAGWLQVLVYPNPYESHRHEHRLGSQKGHARLSSNEPWWETVYVELKAGKLIVHSGGAESSTSSHDDDSLLLRGSAVSIVQVRDARNCFRVMSGLESVVLQALSYNEMLDWATSLVHGISIESGGGFLLDHEKLSDKKVWRATHFKTSNDSASRPTYPIQATRPKSVIAPPNAYGGLVADGTESTTTIESKDSSSRSSDIDSFRSRPSDEANSECKSLLNHRRFEPSDAAGFSNGDLEPFNSFDESRRSVDLAYSSDDNNDTSYDGYDESYTSSTLQEDDPFNMRKTFSSFDGTHCDSNRKFRPSHIDSNGFPIVSRAGAASPKRAIQEARDSDGFPIVSKDGVASPKRAIQEARLQCPEEAKMVREDVLSEIYSTEMKSAAYFENVAMAKEDELSKCSAIEFLNSRSGNIAAADESERSEDNAWLDLTRLTDQELHAIYDSCAQGSDQVNPLSFCKLVRSASEGSTSKGNPYQEMNLFAQLSADGSGGRGVLSKEDFVRGIRDIEEEDGVESSFIQKLIMFVRGQ